MKESSGSASLSVWDAVSIIVGIVVGTGIFETPPWVFQQAAGSATAVGLWAFGGLLSLVGALCYAELASTYPHSGGDYVYLSRAYGPWAGFLFGWAQLAVIATGNVGMMAYVFADYAGKLCGTPPRQGWLFAAAAVALLTLLNLLGVAVGKWAQNLLTLAKILGLAGIPLACLLCPTPVASTRSTSPPGLTALASAMVVVFITYGGWNDAASVAAEVREPRRGVPRALILGILVITVIYLVVNTAYVLALGYAAASTSRTIAADVLQQALGERGAQALCLLVMISALGAVNGVLLTSSRVCAALGAEHALFAWLGWRRRGTGTPWAALLTEGLISLVMIAAIGTGQGRAILDALLSAAGLGAISWEKKGGFETLLRCTAPVFWFFFLLTALSLFVLRFRDGERSRPFAVPLYPLLPALFCLTCAAMVVSGVQYAGLLSLLGGTLVALGLPLYALSRRLGAAAR